MEACRTYLFYRRHHKYIYSDQQQRLLKGVSSTVCFKRDLLVGNNTRVCYVIVNDTIGRCRTALFNGSTSAEQGRVARINAKGVELIGTKDGAAIQEFYQ